MVNTDAHYNFHGSGFLRNYLKSPTDNPADIQTLDIVHAAERGNLVMSNGPFLEVSLRATGEQAVVASPGDNLSARGGDTTLRVRVQCPNWFDIDRVQVLINGRPDPKLNFTREDHPKMFADKNPVVFQHALDLHLAKDAHVIVVATSEKTDLGEVSGPMWGKQHPTAISNPIYVDVDGNGFQPNGDTLGHPLPVKSGAKKQ